MESKELIIQKNVPVAMRDGVRLATDIYRPHSSERVPAILVRLPYSKNRMAISPLAIDSIRAAEAGFAVVIQDTRGRFLSEGEFYPFQFEAQDGEDTIRWLDGQTWCSGVGMTGGSYFGATQLLAGTTQPAALKAIVPLVTTDGYYEGWTYQGGAFQLGFILSWVLQTLAPDTLMRQVAAGKAAPEQLHALLADVDRMGQHYGVLPLKELSALGSAAPYYFDWLQHEALDEYWRQWQIADQHTRINVPALHVGGWFDLFLAGTIRNYTGLRAGAATEAARQGQRLIIGPWAHALMGGAFPQADFGLFANSDVVDLTGIQLRWFDQLLRGKHTGILEEPPVKIFVMGDNRWRDENEWPLARTRYTNYYLHSAGRANTGRGDGSLSPEQPGAEAYDTFLYDPRHPVPTCGGPTFLPGLFVGANAGPRDQREIETREDVLVYTSGPLAQDLEVTGPVQVTLHAATSALDTDFTAKLVDVYPDGTPMSVVDGIIRARYRQGLERAVPVEPEAVLPYTIDLTATATVFKAGHRVRVEISSSNFPRFDRNPGTGHALGVDGEADLRPALQRIFHDSRYPSHLILPVIPR